MAGVTPSLSWIVDFKKTTHTLYKQTAAKNYLLPRKHRVFLKDALNGRLYPGDIFSLS